MLAKASGLLSGTSITLNPAETSWSPTPKTLSGVTPLRIAIIGADFRLLKSCSDVLIIYSPPFLLAQQSN